MFQVCSCINKAEKRRKYNVHHLQLVSGWHEGTEWSPWLSAVQIPGLDRNCIKHTEESNQEKGKIKTRMGVKIKEKTVLKTECMQFMEYVNISKVY